MEITIAESNCFVEPDLYWCQVGAFLLAEPHRRHCCSHSQWMHFKDVRWPLQYGKGVCEVVMCHEVSERKFGGLDVEVEVDECFLTRRKYHKGRRLHTREPIWGSTFKCATIARHVIAIITAHHYTKQLNITHCLFTAGNFWLLQRCLTATGGNINSTPIAVCAILDTDYSTILAHYIRAFLRIHFDYSAA